MTVSRVINRDDSVRAETRAKVEAAIVAMNYAPNPAARKLAGAAQLRIVLIYGNPSRAWLSEVLLGCLAEASRSDVKLLLEQCDDANSALAFALQARGLDLDGVILPPPFCDDACVVAPLLAAGIPVAVVASGAPIDGTFAVMIDDRAAAYDMTRHLAALGHRRIGFITGDPRQTGSALRLEGYRLALAEVGLTADPALVVQGDYTYRSGLRAADDLFRLPEPPTAVFAGNDDMAAATIAAAHRHNKDVPDDVSVAGFDDTALATTISPELTTVRQPILTMAQAAVAMLAAAAPRRRSGKPVQPELRVFAHDLIIRGSAAP
jgi:LacI family transcriptional regulator